MTSTRRSPGLVAAVAGCAAICGLVLVGAHALTPSQERPARLSLPIRPSPVITDVAPKGPDGIALIQAGKPFAIRGRNFPADATDVSVVIVSAVSTTPGRISTSSRELATLRPSVASAERLEVLAPANLPADKRQCFIQVVTKAGARSNAVPVQFGAERQPTERELTIAGYLRDASSNGFSGIRVTATDPAKPIPYEAWTDSSGHYALRMPAPFTGQVLVRRPDNCFDCTLITRNLVNQTSDLSDVNFVCTNTTLIVGRTQTQYNEIISGVRLDGLPGSPVTNSYGDYQVKVPCGWSGTVSPVKLGWAFSPPSFSYSKLTQMPPRRDYIGGALRYSISGAVRTADGAAIAGVKLNGLYPTSSGEFNLTDSSGRYSVSVYYGWSGTATPVKAGYSFSPATRTYTSVVASQQNQDFVAVTTVPEPRGLEPAKVRAEDGSF